MSKEFTNKVFIETQGVFVPELLFSCRDMYNAMAVGDMEYHPIIDKVKNLANYLGVSMDDIYYNENTEVTKKYLYIKGFVYEDLTHYLGMVEEGDMAQNFVLERIRLRIPHLDRQNKDLNTWLKNKEYDMFFAFLEKQMVLYAIKYVIPNIKSSRIWDAFMDAYQMYEGNTNLIPDEIISLLQKYPSSKHRRRRLKELPNKKITLYRGVHSPDNIIGLSWTTSLKVAGYFATRLGGSGAVYKIEVPKDDILDYYMGRDEYEVLLSRYTVRKYSPIRII